MFPVVMSEAKLPVIPDMLLRDPPKPGVQGFGGVALGALPGRVILTGHVPHLVRPLLERRDPAVQPAQRQVRHRQALVHQLLDTSPTYL